MGPAAAQTKWEKEFWEQVGKIGRCRFDEEESDWGGFGYKVKVGNHVYTVPIWDNVLEFFRGVIEQVQSTSSPTPIEVIEAKDPDERRRMLEDFIKKLYFDGK